MTLREVQDLSNEYVSKYGPVLTGSACVTGPGMMKCKSIIHAVGPIWNDRKFKGEWMEPELLYNACINSIKRANELNYNSISIPAISSGIYNFPKPLCAEVLMNCI